MEKEGSRTILAGVPLTDRYMAVWEEIHKRVEIRQNTRIQFAVVAVGGAVASLSAAAQSARLTPWLTGLALSMPFLTWVFVLWSYHNDMIIGLLSLFCASCENVDDPDNRQGIPGFHRRQQEWMLAASKFGRLSDIGDILLVILTGFPAIWLSTARLEGAFVVIKWWMWLFLLIPHFGAAWFIWGKQERRRKIRSDYVFGETGDGWKLMQQ